MSTNTWLGIDTIIPQAVQAGPVDERGLPLYLTQDTFGQVTLKGGTTDVILAAADGIHPSGIDAAIERIAVDVDPANWADLVNHGKEYLYAEFVEPGSPVYRKSRVPHQHGEEFNASYHSLLHFEEATNPTDEYGHTWTASGAARSAVQKKFGDYSYLFDGANDYINGPGFAFSQPFTVELWFFCTDTTTTFRLMGNATAFDGWDIYYDGTKFDFYASSNGGTWNLINGGAGVHTPSQDAWHHYVLEWDGAFYRTYLDGVLDYSAASTTAPYSNQPMVIQIGNAQTTGSLAFIGYLDEFKLTFGNVRYGNAFTPSTEAFTPDALWFDTNKMKMQEGAPGAWTDKVYLPLGYAVCDRRRGALLHFESSDNDTSWWTGLKDDYGNKWTFIGTAQIDTAVKKFGTASLLLDGNSDAITSSEIVTLEDGSWTVDGYFNMNADQDASMFASDEGSHGLLVKYDTSDGALHLYASSNGTDFDIADGTGDALGSETSWTLDGSVFYHIEASFDGTTYRVFVDGVEDITVVSSVTIVATTRFQFGRSAFGIYFSGWIDEPRIAIGTARHTVGFTPDVAARTVDGCIKYIVTAAFKNHLYHTEWIANSDWTNRHIGFDRYNHVKNADEFVEHGDGADMEHIKVRLHLSFTGSWRDSFEVLASDSSGANVYGWQPDQIDLDRVKIHTGTAGLKFLNESGGLTILGQNTEAFYHISVEVTV